VGLILALAASVSWGAGDFLGGLASRKAPLLAVLSVSLTTGLAGALLVVLVSGDTHPGWGPAGVAVLAGLAGLVGLLGLYRGMAIGAMGVVAPISGVAAIVPFAFGIVDGERPSPVQLVGVAAAFAGIALVSREPDGSGESMRAAGVGLALVAAAGFGLYFTLTDVAADDAGAPWTVLVSRGAAAVAALLAAALLRTQIGRVRGPALRLALAAGIFDVTANVAFGVATTRGLISVVSVLASLYPVATVVLARVVLGERASGLQRAGAVAAIGGAALITAG
jgi:drug/metabolite transporter (DMT)-like permease